MRLLLVLVLIVVGLVVVIARRPSEFRVERTTVVAAPPAAVFAQVNDFHKWDAWNPWAKMDPSIEAGRTRARRRALARSTRGPATGKWAKDA